MLKLAETKIEQVVAERDAIIEAYAKASVLVDESRKRADAIRPNLFPFDARLRVSVDEYRKDVDRRLWYTFYREIGLADYFDANAKKAFDVSLDADPPTFDLPNIEAAMEAGARDAQIYLNRGIYMLFVGRDRKYKTNTRHTVKMEKAIILKRCCNTTFGQITLDYLSPFEDLHRSVCVIRGEKYKAMELANRVAQVWKETGEPYQDDTYWLKGCLNGNLHCRILDPYVLDEINRRIALHAGAVLAEDSK
ncbi:MAG: DUF4942 domain-containing protein [Gammaproteobacteria bacterium]|nr:DUF4942 domain-containing protein [Gammaproteobacteria bacterium]